MPEDRSHKGPRPTKFTILDHARPFNGNLFALDTVKAEWAGYAKKADDPPGEFNRPQTLEITRRGDAVAALLFDREQRNVILVEQFRLATTPQFRQLVDKTQPLQPEIGAFADPQAWLLETVAGSLTDPAMRPEDCLKQEVLDEAGYAVQRVRQIGKYFSSPGGSTELIHLFYAEVTDLQRDPDRGGGNEGEGENIDVVKIPLEEFFLKLERREFLDAKIIIAGYWLRDNLGDLLAQPSESVQHPAPYRVRGTDQLVGIKLGRIEEVQGVHVLVNPENTNMQMDLYSGRSVSAAIRWAGAVRQARKGEENDRSKDIVVEDPIEDDLRRQLGNRRYVPLTTVIMTKSGQLEPMREVRRIAHVAAAEGWFQQGLKAQISTLRQCVERVLETIELGNSNRPFYTPYKSVLIPMMGAGNGGLPVYQVAPALVERGLEFLQRRPNSKLNEIYFNAYAMSDLIVLRKVLDEYVEKGVLEKTATT